MYLKLPLISWLEDTAGAALDEATICSNWSRSCRSSNSGLRAKKYPSGIPSLQLKPVEPPHDRPSARLLSHAAFAIFVTLARLGVELKDGVLSKLPYLAAYHRGSFNKTFSTPNISKRMVLGMSMSRTVLPSVPTWQGFGVVPR